MPRCATNCRAGDLHQTLASASVALHTQVVLREEFVLVKAKDIAAAASESTDYLRCHFELLFQPVYSKGKQSP
jgi:hypothetical protein